MNSTPVNSPRRRPGSFKAGHKKWGGHNRVPCLAQAATVSSPASTARGEVGSFLNLMNLIIRYSSARCQWPDLCVIRRASIACACGTARPHLDAPDLSAPTVPDSGSEKAAISSRIAGMNGVRGRRGSVYPAKWKGRYGYHKTCARPGRIGSVARSASDRLGSPNLGRCCRYLGAPDHGGKKQPGGSRFAGASIASSSFWLPIQPSSGLLRHETGRRSDRGASRVRSAKTVPRPASEMGDLGCVYMAGHELQSA
jgi:hypothetical protein